MVALLYRKNLLNIRDHLFLFPAGGASVHFLTTNSFRRKKINLPSSVYNHDSCAPGCFVRPREEYSISHSWETFVAMKYVYWQSYVVSHTGFVFTLMSIKSKEVRRVSREGQNLFISAVTVWVTISLRKKSLASISWKPPGFKLQLFHEI